MFTDGGKNQRVTGFVYLQKQIKASAKLIQRNPDMVQCIFTDTSEKNWEVAATKFAAQQLEKTIHEKTYEPLAFLTETFSKRKYHWSSYERQAFSKLNLSGSWIT